MKAIPTHANCALTSWPSMGAASGVRPSVYETWRITKVLAYSQSFQWGCAIRHCVKGVGTVRDDNVCCYSPHLRKGSWSVRNLATVTRSI